ncbi:MAG: hypothetical protein J1E63_07320 [Muribaculaceae bacterium]|nr:hypothetical protein [Muribaculaceae bacterium]
MSTYKSKATTVNQPVETTFENISNLPRLQEYINRLPQEELQKIGEINFTEDSIVIKAPAVGEIVLKVVERTAPSRMKFAPVSSPIQMEVAFNLAAEGASTTALSTELDVDIPMMLKPMVGPKLQGVADRMAEVIANLLNRG